MTALNVVVPAISAMIGALIALGGVWLTNWQANKRFLTQLDRDERKEKRDFIRQRGEELYGLADDWATYVWQEHLIWLAAMHGRHSVQEARDLAIENAKGHHDQFRKVSMLMNVYFDELRDALSELNLCRIKLDLHQSRFLKVAKSETSDWTRAAKRHRTLMQDLQGAQARFLKLLAEIIRNA
ncbi:hypothetical protein HDG34_005670 [Paraburkholderia sp. HC6.4b]|uniref:hypothetical protein n=1 Tax=unclassified Paraburkholderia TaxID=2615204 RepID=UPI00160C877C|nr:MULTISPECIES: hypothetical protein [unclassified Paraburkholderia]MBB5411709.1 hypothetical protein [Paraburkholderia sp. HC6.4b]MBB5453262.1 hypothetical protein [Paraburkholderia sp. Kb1A]